MTDEKGHADRRAFARRASRGVVRYRAAGKRRTTPAAAFLLDISADGVRMMVSEPLKAGTSIEVELEPATGSDRLNLEATICHVTSLPEGQFTIGCTWKKRVTLQELRMLL